MSQCECRAMKGHHPLCSSYQAPKRVRVNWKRQAEVECQAKLRLEGEVGHLKREISEYRKFLAFVALRPGSGGSELNYSRLPSSLSFLLTMRINLDKS